MINLPSKFETENNKGENSPSVIVDMQEIVLEVEETLQVDWQANTGELNVDYNSQPGDVILDRGAAAIENHETGGTAFGPDGQTGQDIQAQGFKLSTSSGVSRVALRLHNDASATCRARIYSGWSGGGGVLLGTSTNTVVGSAAWYDFNFDDIITLSSGTQYHIVLNHVSGGAFDNAGEGWYAGSNLYADGTYWQSTAGSPFWVEFPSNDAYFRVYGGFQSTGYIFTDEMDLGVTPTKDGEWILSDLTPDDSSIVFEAWSSATGAFGGEEASLGTIVDGDEITDRKRYYRVKATFTPNTSSDETPTLQSIKADFTSIVTYSDNPDLGYEVALDSLSTLTTTVDTFKPSTVGQMTLTFDHTPSLSDWVSTKFPKNKDVIIYAGFRAEGWTKQDHIQFFHGQVDSWSLNAADKIVIIVKDFSKEWSVDVPSKWESAADDVTWTAEHPIDVMLDILQNQINVRNSKIDLDSFETVKTALSGWKVTRTITGDPVDGKKLMEELRILCSAIFIPNANGSIGIKIFDPAEAEIDSLTDTDFIRNPSWDPNADSLVNRTLIYTNWDGNGNSASDYSDVDISARTTSQTNHNEIATYELKDNWTRTAEKAVQITNGLATDILDRFEDMPAILNVIVDRKKIYYEPGDIVKVTTLHAPSSDGNGIEDVKFQIVNKNLDFLRDRISLRILEV